MDHIGHCRQLHIKQSGDHDLVAALETISSKPVPELVHIYLSSGYVINLHDQLFPYGAPRLKIADLDALEPLTAHLCLPAFKSVTTLRLANVYINEDNEYNAFRDFLVALQVLIHLELHLTHLEGSVHSSIVLPTIHFLHIDSDSDYEHLGTLLSEIHATSLVTLSIAVRNGHGDVCAIWNLPELHLPSVKHLILSRMGACMVARKDRDLKLLARRFPDVERLTYSQMAMNPQKWDINSLIEDMFSSYPTIYKRGKPEMKINTIAIFAENHQYFDAWRLRDGLLKLRQYGYQLHTIMLPKHVWDQANEKQILELKTLTEVKEFLVDWPLPFEILDSTPACTDSALTEGGGRED
ncbi:hypothetical protein HWV62_44035 [Athelia sp. TMB]|nr:hypothetical protein HWV62_44035 [Athelia sp. TMB]